MAIATLAFVTFVPLSAFAADDKFEGRTLPQSMTNPANADAPYNISNTGGGGAAAGGAATGTRGDFPSQLPTKSTPPKTTPLKIKPNTDLILLQPLDDATYSLSAKPGVQIFFDYFNLSWPWILGVAAGLAVLQAMVGGMMMMTPSGNQSGKDRMMYATAGLLIIALAGLILSTINPLFYN